jgi:hypothetical protein
MSHQNTWNWHVSNAFDLLSYLLLSTFELTIQNTANRQVRNLFLEVSLLYLSRFPWRALLLLLWQLRIFAVAAAAETRYC